jgi:hypothetical protein
MEISTLFVFVIAMALVAVIGLAMVYGNYARHRRETDRLKHDVHTLLAGSDPTGRRAHDFQVDILEWHVQGRDRDPAVLPVQFAAQLRG